MLNLPCTDYGLSSCCSNPFFHDLGFSALLARDPKCRSEEPDSDCLSEFPGENYYSLKILKGNIEPRPNSPGSCAHLRVDCICSDSTLNPEAKSRCSLEHHPAAEGYGQVKFMQFSPCCSYSVLHWQPSTGDGVDQDH